MNVSCGQMQTVYCTSGQHCCLDVLGHFGKCCSSVQNCDVNTTNGLPFCTAESTSSSSELIPGLSEVELIIILVIVIFVFLVGFYYCLRANRLYVYFSGDRASLCVGKTWNPTTWCSCPRLTRSRNAYQPTRQIQLEDFNSAARIENGLSMLSIGDDYSQSSSGEFARTYVNVSRADLPSPKRSIKHKENAISTVSEVLPGDLFLCVEGQEENHLRDHYPQAEVATNGSIPVCIAAIASDADLKKASSTSPSKK